MSLDILQPALHEDIHAMLDVDVDDIFASVFSAFEDEEEVETQKMSAVPDLNLHIQTSNPLGQWVNSYINYAAPVTPTSSCVELARFEEGNGDASFDPTPLADFMTAPDFIMMGLPEPAGQHMRAISPVQNGCYTATRPTKKRRGDKSSAVTTAVVPAEAPKERKSHTKRAPSSSSSVQDKESPDAVEQTRQRNREHARKSRMRRKVLTTNLQQTLDDLKAENDKLRGFIMQSIEQGRATSLLKKAQVPAPAEQFIAALKQPENRVVDDSTLTFLKGLQKDAITVNNIQASSAKDADEDLGAFIVVG